MFSWGKRLYTKHKFNKMKTPLFSLHRTSWVTVKYIWISHLITLGD